MSAENFYSAFSKSYANEKNKSVLRKDEYDERIQFIRKFIENPLTKTKSQQERNLLQS
jgi:hypothetical protein